VFASRLSDSIYGSIERLWGGFRIKKDPNIVAQKLPSTPSVGIWGGRFEGLRKSISQNKASLCFVCSLKEKNIHDNECTAFALDAKKRATGS
jgi:hypothetical protein